MTTPEDRFYNPAKINFWFAISAVLALAGMAGALIQDHFDRDWKGYQDGFYAMERERAEALAALRDIDGARESDDVRRMAWGLFREGGTEAGAILPADAFKAAVEAARTAETFPRAAAVAALLYEAEAARAGADEALVAETAALEQAITDLENARFRAEIEQRKLQSDVDERKSQMEHAAVQGHETERAHLHGEWEKLVAAEAEIHATMDSRRLERDQKREELKKLRQEVSMPADRAAQLWDRAGVTAAERKLASLFMQPLRDAPGLDVAAPVLKIDQVVIPSLTVDQNFSKNPRVDRCMTCHKGIDKIRVDPATREVTAVFTEENTPEKVYRTHPRPELFVSSVSPHSLSKMGCTGCHGGQGMGLTFTSAYHTPSSHEQEKEWEEKYHWHKGHSWDYPMLPQKYIEASCLQCHGDPSDRDKNFTFAKDIPAAPLWNRGKRLVEQSGCYGCHKIDGYSVPGLDKELTEIKNPSVLAERMVATIGKAGPSLERIASKAPDKESLYKWIWGPRDLRPTTHMPHFFAQPNNTGTDPVTGVNYDLRTQAEAWGMVEYLMAKSGDWKAETPKVAGDAARGKDLFGSIGCLSCHGMDDFPHPDGGAANNAGPDLSTVGSKTTRDWLYTWAKNPTHYWEGTRMPSLRLTDHEAADIAAYLTGKRDTAWEQRTLAAPSDAAVRQLAIEAALVGKAAGIDPTAAVEAMTPQARLLSVGERAIARYGCFACHDIPGMEGKERIGTGLGGSEGWGSKDVDRLDFGQLLEPAGVQRFAADWGNGHLDDLAKEGVGLPHRRADWARLKMLNPRVYDAGMTKKPLERLMMPNFGFSGEDADAAVTYLLSLQRWEIPRSMRPKLDTADLQGERMKWVATRLNCYGCHTINRHEIVNEDGEREWTHQGGDIRPWITDQAKWPPVLGGAPKKEFPAIDKETGEFEVLPVMQPWLRDNRAPAEGFKVHPDWLFTFLRDPGAHLLRPYLQVRMPTFHYTEAELNALVSDFAAWDHVTGPFTFGGWTPLSAQERAEAAGLFKQIGCTACHSAGDLGRPDGTPSAPDLTRGWGRLRREWILKWMDNPAGLQPGTSMPAIFRSGADERVLEKPPGVEGTFFGDDPHVQLEKIADLLLGLGFKQSK